MNKLIAILGAIGLVVIIVFAAKSGDAPDGGSASPTPSVSTSTLPTGSAQPSITPTASGSPKPSSSTPPAGIRTTPSPSPSAVKTFNITGKPFQFDPVEIRVKKGDTVKIVFTNTEGMHDWVLDEFKARTPVLQAGKTAAVEFVADKTGDFEYYCSVGNHHELGMRGNLIVE